KPLNFGSHRPRCGRLPWSASTVHHILADPIYAGTAYSNRYRYVPPKRPRRTRGPHTAEASCRQPRPREEWIPIAVPAILDATTTQRAQEQLGRNALPGLAWRVLPGHVRPNASVDEKPTSAPAILPPRP